MSNRRRTLSSALTFYFKMVTPILPGVFSLGYGIWLVLNPELSFPGVPFLLIWVVSAGLFFRFHFRIKRVETDDYCLYVSNYFREVSIPLSEIESVSESWLVNPKLVYIHLKTDSPFGRKIVFAPTLRVLSQFKHHPVVDDLRRRLRQHSY